MRSSGSTPGLPRVRRTRQTLLKIPSTGSGGSGRTRSGRAGRGLCGPHRTLETTCDANHWRRNDSISVVANAFLKLAVHHLTLQPPPPTPLSHSPCCPRWPTVCNSMDSREARRVLDGAVGTVGGQSETVWLGEQEVRALAAPLCEEDLSRRGDEIVLGERWWP